MADTSELLCLLLNGHDPDPNNPGTCLKCGLKRPTDPERVYRGLLSNLVHTAMKAQREIAQLSQLAHQLGRVDEADRLERLDQLADGVEESVRDVLREVDGLHNPGHTTRLIVADVAVPQNCLANRHTPAPLNPGRCLYCYASPLNLEQEVRRG